MPEPADHTIIPTRRSQLRLRLSRIPVFQGVPDDVMDELVLQFRFAEVEAGAVIVQQNTPGDQLFVVDDGDLEVTAVLNGRPVRLGQLKAGDFFGEVAVLTGATRTATVTARTPVRLWTLSGATLAEWIQRSPELGARMREVMRKRQLANALKALQ
jgi:CRP/FNR family transcriptional regulator, cyclic AMP receptor protein